MEEDFIERRMIIGLIVSTDYVQQILPVWDSSLLESSTARLLAGWCLDYFDQYHHAPARDIEGIYAQKLKDGLSDDKAQWIEEVLANLSKEHEHSEFNVQYLLDQTRRHLQERHLRGFAENIRSELGAGNVVRAEELAASFVSVLKANVSSVDPFSADARALVRQAFMERQQPLIKFPVESMQRRALGSFLNPELVRGGFVAFMGPEKVGKTFLLMEMAMQAIRSGYNTVFFQAGDMTEAQQIRRLGIYLAQRSDEARYCKTLYVPTTDCRLNQIDQCKRRERESSSGITSNGSGLPLTFEELVSACERNREHAPCYNCDQMQGVPWLTRRDPVKPLQWKEAHEALKNFGREHSARFKLSSYPNETLTMAEIKSLLTLWERQEGFVPDVVVVDYADILESDLDCKNLLARDQHNKIWQRLRRLSQERHCLVVTATQTDAASYEQIILTRRNFSEDKRKYSHVTAMYGLNQTEEEALIGIMRINEIVVREGHYDRRRCVKLLQRLEMGRPFVGSFF